MTEELLDVKVEVKFPYRYALGGVYGPFARALRDEGRIMGRRCPGCGKVYLPPRPVCGPCFRETDEWVEVGPEGTLETFTVVYFAFLDPMTGKKRPAPYGYGMVRLDGAGSRFQHFLSVSDYDKLQVGMRMRPVFAEERTGRLSDIIWFEPVEAGSE